MHCLDGAYMLRCVCHYQVAVDSGSLKAMQLTPKQTPAWALYLVIAKSAEWTWPTMADCAALGFAELCPFIPWTRSS